MTSKLKRILHARNPRFVTAWYNNRGYVNVTAMTEHVAADIEIARTWKLGTLIDDGKQGGSEKGLEHSCAPNSCGT
jgi:hypothetical protein